MISKNIGIARYVKTLSIFILLICSLLSWHFLTVLLHTFSIKVYLISAKAAFRSNPQSFSISSILCSIISSSFWESSNLLIISSSFSTIFVAANRGDMPILAAWSSTWCDTAWIQRCTGPCSQKSMTFGRIFFLPTSTVALIRSSIPSSFAALIGIAGIPSSSDICL